MDVLPSANLRQQKLEQQRLKIEQKQRQKREAGKLIQASDLKSASSVKRGARPLSGRRELHGYEGPLQFLHGGNPDDMTTVQVNKQEYRIYRTTSFSALSSFSATPRLVRPPYTRIIRPY